MEPLSIDEILDETNQLDITPRQKHWLVIEVSFHFCTVSQKKHKALANNFTK